MPSPSDVFMSLVQGVAAQKWGELSRLYAAQTDVRHPMSHSSPPLLTQEAVARHFEAAGAAVTGTALVWDLNPKQQLKGPLWEALAGKDAKEAFRATRGSPAPRSVSVSP